jgi:hypothetical protein
VKRIPATITAAIAVGGLLLGLTACSGGTSDEEARKREQATSATGDTLEKKNLEEKRRREENPNAIRYVYLMSFGKVLGYYTAKGKISSSGSQKAPEQDIVWTCKNSHGCSPVVVDSKQDDGTYGSSDPGIFFFTTEGAKVVTNLDYVESDQPIPFDVPKLNKS